MEGSTAVVGKAHRNGNGPEVASLVQLAIDKGTSVEVLERLVALQERVNEREARAAFFAALAAFREECPPITKTRENTQFEVTREGVKRAARYAPLDEIDRVARPVAAKHGLIWTWDTRVEDALMHISCRVTHVLGHSETTNVSMPHESKAGSSPQQKYGSTQMYGMRYSLVAALGITTADPDTDGAGGAIQEVTEEELANIESLISEVNADRMKFLDHFKLGTLDQLQRRDYAKAVQMLEKKRRVRT